MASTNGEVYTLAGASIDAHRAGDFEEEARLMKLKPMHPRIAKAVKSFLGPKYLIEHGLIRARLLRGLVVTGLRGELDIIDHI
jgi:hypothetical protein